MYVATGGSMVVVIHSRSIHLRLQITLTLLTDRLMTGPFDFKLLILFFSFNIFLKPLEL